VVVFFRAEKTNEHLSIKRKNNAQMEAEAADGVCRQDLDTDAVVGKYVLGD
jgi:hypothetical protein